jgi:hypothetical protein
MNDDLDPEDKPSFFDSGEESKSWPPSDNYETENDKAADPANSSSQSFFDSNDEIFETIIEKSNEATNTTDDFLDSDDFLDQLIDNVDEKSNINNMRIVDDEIEEIDFKPKINDAIEPKVLSTEEIVSNKQETDMSYEDDLEHDIHIEKVENINTFQEAVIDDDDFDLDDLLEDDFVQKPNKEESFNEDLLATSIGSTGMAFSDPEGITHSEPDFTKEIEEEFNTDYSSIEEQNFQTQTSFEDGYAESEFVEFVDDETNSELKPFRTFTKINLAEELAEEKEEDDEAGGILAGMNRNMLIIIAIILLSLGYFIFNTFFNKTIESRSRERRRPPAKEKIFSKIEQVLAPVWEISSQKIVNPSIEDQYAKSLVKYTGRENPFAMPQSVIDALKRQSDAALLAKQKPNTYKRLAYRATLLGVLTSEGSTIALVNMQEATFDIIEGTSKSKVLSLATKSMDKAKQNTLEMGQGSFIGPWEIVDVSAPKGAFSDAKITIEFMGTQKALSMGKAEDLGIFDAVGQLDDLESTENALEEDDDDF